MLKLWCTFGYFCSLFFFNGFKECSSVAVCCLSQISDQEKLRPIFIAYKYPPLGDLNGETGAHNLSICSNTCAKFLEANISRCTARVKYV